eukprot:CAMPEP_0115517666 /NCGR_PEP_ID=MMETSP0271-20121206/77440_1 /TAXON_ID=71861 /ORGANISM="Scrippsiella trochoidea, Strain CCMP3099" /LENGTH=325 /DNA_ID=CAMNT_0002948457 /DNA_START=117 /DNA_END=1096 /DNA_ORIENTATION=+
MSFTALVAPLALANNVRNAEWYIPVFALALPTSTSAALAPSATVAPSPRTPAAITTPPTGAPGVTALSTAAAAATPSITPAATARATAQLWAPVPPVAPASPAHTASASVDVITWAHTAHRGCSTEATLIRQTLCAPLLRAAVHTSPAAPAAGASASPAPLAAAPSSAPVPAPPMVAAEAAAAAAARSVARCGTIRAARAAVTSTIPITLIPASARTLLPALGALSSGRRLLTINFDWAPPLTDNRAEAAAAAAAAAMRCCCLVFALTSRLRPVLSSSFSARSFKSAISSRLLANLSSNPATLASANCCACRKLADSDSALLCAS